jgi:transcriptional regulator with XRE-family HTH domain
MVRQAAGAQLRDCRQVGARLAILRAARGVTQTELAEATGRSARALAGIESGEWTVTDEDIATLAAALDIDPGWLLSGRRPGAHRA